MLMAEKISEAFVNIRYKYSKNILSLKTPKTIGKYNYYFLYGINV